MEARLKGNLGRPCACVTLWHPRVCQPLRCTTQRTACNLRGGGTEGRSSGGVSSPRLASGWQHPLSSSCLSSISGAPVVAALSWLLHLDGGRFSVTTVTFWGRHPPGDGTLGAGVAREQDGRVQGGWEAEGREKKRLGRLCRKGREDGVGTTFQLSTSIAHQQQPADLAAVAIFAASTPTSPPPQPHLRLHHSPHRLHHPPRRCRNAHRRCRRHHRHYCQHHCREHPWNVTQAHPPSAPHFCPTAMLSCIPPLFEWVSQLSAAPHPPPSPPLPPTSISWPRPIFLNRRLPSPLHLYILLSIFFF